jgi:hypothetical protein
MARFPGAVWKPVDRYKPGGSSHQAITGPNRLVFHTAVSSGSSLFDLFNQPGNPIAHFYVREDGTVEQYCDTDTRSSAVLDGNYDCVTVESWDGGPSAFHGTDGPDWTPAQVEACAEIAVWCNKVHGIPFTVLDDSRPGRGIGWHRLGIDGNFPGGILHGRRPGAELWSPSAGKSCPGDSKIRGVVDDIVPRAIDIANGDDMSAEDVKAINTVTRNQADRVIEVVRGQAEIQAKRNARVLAAIDALPDKELTKKDVRAAVENALAAQEETV